MSKIFENGNIIKALQKYDPTFSLDDPGAQKIISFVTASLLLIIPDIAAYIYRYKMNISSDKCAYMAFAALGTLLKEVGEKNLKKLEEGEENENDISAFVGDIGIKLCN